MTAPAGGAIHRVEARVLERRELPAGQCVLRLEAPAIARGAAPGSFVHLRPEAGATLLPRPLSILWADREAGAVELLFKVVGRGTAALARLRPGEVRLALGPVGRGFAPAPERDRPLLVGGGVGIPPILFLARGLRGRAEPFVVLGSEIPFPFPSRPSAVRVPGAPAGAIAAMALLEDLDVASRLCSLQGYPGCHRGYVDDLARRWLAAQDGARRRRVAVYACGPLPMLRAVARLAREFELPCQVAVEEYMACGVGGCAGCALPVRAAAGPAMRRVCVDGPVFDAREVFFDAPERDGPRPDAGRGDSL